ncbi:hypothetical protein A8709_15560 [Paenibacillus pectinilyticus]|uniref:Uncharacterized protein n=1 Tax=Paenibacillus pectinilyticus TaxID=512399 RepID=A0A1C1A4J9_9BACL|nr:hypothetical protein [Paenibacillus pectinilyticus]OCT15491.1 hypothetical protein A8709_15560 [Paenibacillus pectinilyticus]
MNKTSYLFPNLPHFIGSIREWLLGFTSPRTSTTTQPLAPPPEIVISDLPTESPGIPSEIHLAPIETQHIWLESLKVGNHLHAQHALQTIFKPILAANAQAPVHRVQFIGLLTHLHSLMSQLGIEWSYSELKSSFQYASPDELYHRLHTLSTEICLRMK